MDMGDHNIDITSNYIHNVLVFQYIYVYIFRSRKPASYHELGKVLGRDFVLHMVPQ